MIIKTWIHPTSSLLLRKCIFKSLTGNSKYFQYVSRELMVLWKPSGLHFSHVFTLFSSILPQCRDHCLFLYFAFTALSFKHSVSNARQKGKGKPFLYPCNTLWMRIGEFSLSLCPLKIYHQQNCGLAENQYLGWELGNLKLWKTFCFSYFSIIS